MNVRRTPLHRWAMGEQGYIEVIDVGQETQAIRLAIGSGDAEIWVGLDNGEIHLWHAALTQAVMAIEENGRE